MNIQNLKKTELHCHLDGSLSKKMISSYLGREIKNEELSVSENCKSLTEYLEKFDLPLECLQDALGLEAGAYSFMQSLVNDGVQVVEVRFAPMLSTNGKLNCKQVMEAVRTGLERGKAEFGIEYGMIACAMRHHSLAKNITMLDEVAEFYGKGLVAFDLAGDENAFPTNLFREFFLKANELHIPYTIHSGETGSLENMKVAYELGAKRVGHGIALAKDSRLLKAYAEAGIGVEICPTSNFQTKAVNSWEEYPLPLFLEHGIKVSINTDNRTVSNTTLTKELEKVYLQYGNDETLIHLLLQNAELLSFLNL